MNTAERTRRARRSGALILLLILLTAQPSLSEPTPAALAAFKSYTDTVESRLAQQHHATNAFLAPQPSTAQAQRLRQGEPGEPIIVPVTEPATPPAAHEFPGAMLHHWRGTAFVPGAKAQDFEHLLRNFDSYPRVFSPQVLEAQVLSQTPALSQVRMRVRQHHVITVVLDTTYDVTFGRLDPQHGYSISRSNRIVEIDSPGTRTERVLTPTEEHGFLWRLNTYWSYEERDGGLYLQIEALSLTRSVPAAFAWAIRPYIESIPRESLEFTLRSTCRALKAKSG